MHRTRRWGAGRRGGPVAIRLALVVASIGVAAGCASTPDARYVYQDGEFGVIGIPRNSPFGKKDYNQQARELMSRHFPEGFEVVRAEEVVEGERTLDTAIKKELASEPGVSAFNQMLKIGRFAHSSSVDEKDVTHITESRIIYRRRPTGPEAGPDGFARLANQAPSLYLDPNGIARKMGDEAMMVAKKIDSAKDARPAADDKKAEVAAAKPKDEGVRKASTAAPPGN